MAKKSNSFDDKHFKKSELKAKNIGKLYFELIQQILSKFRIVDLKPNQFFAFDDYNQYKNMMEKMFEAFAINITTEINKQSKESWNYANKKNQKMLDDVRKKFGITKIQLRDNYKKRNLEALSAFQNRKESGLNLSQRVFKQTEKYKKEIELSIDVALRDGKSAQELARDVKQYLQEPDKLFRKVRDQQGNLGLSKAAKEYHPGRGVYRSSHKNAMRLARTENNMAYHESNFHNYQEMDFIIGIKIKLSNNPNHCPFCEMMQGDYPKDYKFLGWHPHCRCTTIPILKSRTELQEDDVRILQGKEPERSKNEVLNTPQAYKDYIDKNEAKLLSMPNKPYWYRDNSGLKIKDPVIEKIPEKKIKKIKSDIEKKAIQEKWDKRIEVHEGIKSEAAGLISNFDKWRFALEGSDYLKVYDLEDLLSKNKLFDLKGIFPEAKNIIQDITIKKHTEWSEFLTPQFNGWKNFDPADVENAINSAKLKIKEWKDNVYMNSVDDKWFEQKLHFEVGFVESKKTYPTWEIAKNVYEKALFNEKYIPYQNKSKELIEFLEIELKKNPTKKGLSFIEDLKKLDLQVSKDFILGDLPDKIDEVEAYVKIRKSKVKLKGSKAKISSDFTEERLRAVSLPDDPEIAHNQFIDRTSGRWLKMDDETKKTLWSYTNSSGKINRPLRGFDTSWYNEKGLGKVPFGNENADLNYTKAKGLDLNKGIPKMAKELENHAFDKDTWLRRGETVTHFNARFGLDLSDFEGRFEELIGRKGVDEAFLSTSPASGKGFHDTIELKIFAPKGTQGIYAEPFSHFGKTLEGLDWKGSKKFYGASSEFEVIINQGYEMQIHSIKKGNYGKYEIEVILTKRKSFYKF